MSAPTPVALVGVGKIARDQHIPALAASPDFELAATASRNASVEGVDAYRDVTSLLAARPDIPCLSLCTPPQVRYGDARRALEAGRHVMLEKPPGATISEVEDLIELAKSRSLSLYLTWHSRQNQAVAAARSWLSDKTIQSVSITWKEDVRRWHPGQEWVWRPGGLGVFDPGINALSILTEIYPGPLRLSGAKLVFPSNRQTPIAASLSFQDLKGAAVSAEFDWRQEGRQTWEIRIAAVEGDAVLGDGGSTLTVDGAPTAPIAPGAAPDLDFLQGEYHALYAQFARLLAAGASDTDLAPLRHVADAFLLGERIVTAPFDW
ncbi:MAG: Gfo/Idh/MocA family oxidoreductase [Alphaproteobacteria bacterium]|nr:Gfo/Idh/MocA family oxidoreductase [Alphaproteobacteria bacterium]